MKDKTKRMLFLATGFFFVGLGLIGVALPVLPTTPFLIVAAYCFSKSSERWHEWLLSNPIFGSSLRDWEKSGVIRMRAKITAVCLITISFTTLWFTIKAPVYARVAMLSIGVIVSIFILSRPSSPRQQN